MLKCGIQLIHYEKCIVKAICIKIPYNKGDLKTSIKTLLEIFLSLHILIATPAGRYLPHYLKCLF